jgi:hypothetical protein
MLISRAHIYWIVALIFGFAISLPLVWALSQFHPSSDAPHIESSNQAAKDGATYVIQQPEEWGSPLVIVSGVLCAITLGLACYTRGLFRETAKLARESNAASAKALAGSLAHTQTLANIERAYVVGGGGTVVINSVRHFSVDVGNCGKTPAFLIAYDVNFGTLDEINSYPCTVSPNYPYDDQLPPQVWKGGIDRIPIPAGAEVVYGAFWYEDWAKEKRLYKFILSIGPVITRPDVSGIDDMYRYRD